MIKAIYDLDMTPMRTLPIIINVSQYDDLGRTLVFNLFSSSGKWTAPTSAAVTFEGGKPDGKFFAYNCAYSNGTVTVTIQQQMTAVAGKVKCKVKVTSGDKVVESAPIIMVVDAAAVPDGSDMSKSDINDAVANATQKIVDQVRDNIPSDYVQLSTDVSSLKGDLGDLKDCFDISPNLYNTNASGVLNGAYLNLSDGVSIIKDSSTINWRTSDYIDLYNNEGSIYLKRNTSTGNVVVLNARVYWYDENKSFLSGENTTISTVSIPNNARYIRISEEISIQYGYKCSVSLVDIEKIDDYGTIYSLKENYYEKGSDDNYDDVIEKITNKMELYESPNLYDADDASWEDGYISHNGQSGTGTVPHKNKLFDVSEGDVFYCYNTSSDGTLYVNRTGSSENFGIRFVCAYDSTGAIIQSSGASNAVWKYVVPTGITKIRISVRANITTCITKNIDMIGMPYVGKFEPYYRATSDFLKNADINLPNALETYAYGDFGLSKELQQVSGITIELEKNAIKKNKHLSFFADITNFDSLTIGHGKTEYGGSFATITNTTITVYEYQFSAITKKTIEHGLTIKNNIGILVEVGNREIANITIVSDGEIARIENVYWKGTNGNIFAEIPSTTTLNNIKMSWICDDYRKNVWLFGDSYISTTSSERWVKYLLDWCGDNILLNAYPGEASERAFADLQNALKHGTPKYLVWCIGMNNGDTSDAISTIYKTYLEQVMSICNKNKIELILATIPNTPSINHTFKNEYIRNSGYKYIDFAKAVGADSYPSNWYDGMLSGDKVHPFEKGAKSLAMKAITDFPKLMEKS